MHVPTSDEEEAWGWRSGDEARGRAPHAWARTHSPPRRNLRTRKPAQLRPYTLEAYTYRRELVRNDWGDAVVPQRGIDAPRQSPARSVRSSSESEASLDIPVYTAPSPSPSSDSTDYERRFRVLRRMMPTRAARRCIEDLRAMRHGHAYHPDGSSSESDAPPPRRSPTPPGALRPGETRRRTGTRGANVPLLSTSESESESPTPPPPSPPSPASPEPRTPEAAVADGVNDRVGTLVSKPRSAWYSTRRPRSPARERDAIDRALARATEPRSRTAASRAAERHAPERPDAERARVAAPRLDVGAHHVLFEAPRAPARREPKKVVRSAVWIAPPETPPAPPPPPPSLPAIFRRQAVPPELEGQLAAAAAWEALENVRFDFGIVPPPVGSRLAPESAIGRGRLHAVLNCEDVSSAFVHGERLDADMDAEAAGDALARIVDSMVDGHGEHSGDALFFFGQWFGRQHSSEVATMLLETAQSALDRLDGAGDAVIALLWFRVHVLWRSHQHSGCADDVLAHARPLVYTLLCRGVHRAFTEPAVAEAWISVIHVLCALDGPGAFWHVLDAALADWHAARAPHAVIWSEVVWYVLGAVCALSCYSAAAGVAHAPRLDAHWGAVQRVLTALPLRFDARVERAAPRAALRRRDAYIRILLRRCLLFAERWGWSLARADGVVARMFDVFDAHRLADLPTETDHDFAPFLRRFDAAALADGHTAFQLYLELLGRTGAGGGHAARLFSRVTPVRVMPFTRTAVPTAAERSMLFNHYSAVMLFLYYVPQSAPQRLRQIKSFLVFATADASSRVACVRAMMYAGVLLRHHAADLAPVAQWFAEVINVLLDERGHGDDVRAREAHRTLAVVLRSISHVIAHAALAPDAAGYPPVALLAVACQPRVLASDAHVCAEALGCVQQFLRARKRVQEQPPPSPSSDMELDDALMHDAALGALLGEAPVRSDDAEFAQYAHDTLSPALFQLLADSQHPDRVSAREPRVEALVRRAEDESRSALLVDCWAGCAAVLVAHELRDWRAYFTLGRESWKRLGDPVAKRSIALRLAVNVALLDASAYSVLRAEFMGIWVQSLAADVSLQPALTGLLLFVLDPESPLLRGVAELLDVPRDTLPPFDAAQRIRVDVFAEKRGALAATVLGNLGALVAPQPHLPWTERAPDEMPLVVSCVSALLSAIRAHARGTREYVSFSMHVIYHVRAMGELVGRAVRTELHATEAALSVS